MSAKTSERTRLLKYVFHKLKSDEGLSKEEYESLKSQKLSATETVETYIRNRHDEGGNVIWIDDHTRLIEPRTCPHCSGSGIFDERMNATD